MTLVVKRREFTAGLFSLGLAGWTPAVQAALSEADAATAVRAALERGALAAVALLGRTDGFLGNPQVRIPLPGFLHEAAKLLKATGQQRRVDELVPAMNRAAEAAVPEAKALFVSTVKAMSVNDAIRLVRDRSPTAVTAYFAGKTRAPLGERFLPIVTRATERVQLAARYDSVAGRAASLGLLKGDESNVQKYVTAKALDGLYLMVGEEEKKIRADPVRTGSAVLQKVFGI